MKYQAVIFDLDGTLLDTLTDLWNAVNAACKKYGCAPRTRLQVRRALGNGLERLLRLSLPEDMEENRFQTAFQFFRGYYLKHCDEETRPYEGIPELLRKLQQKGIRLAIVSNKAHPAVRELRDRYFPETMQVAIGESVEIRRKPAPDTVFKALEELGIPKEQAVYVGDSEVDKKRRTMPGWTVFWSLGAFGTGMNWQLWSLRPSSTGRNRSWRK